MKVLFQGAGAIGIAGAALFTDDHEVAVVSRAAGPHRRASFPRRVSVFDPTHSRKVGVGDGSCREGRGRAGGSSEGEIGELKADVRARAMAGR